MSLLNLRSLFQDELENNVDSFQSNQPVDSFDTKFNYNIITSIAQTFTFDVENNPPILDSVLRGRVYDQIQFSQNFENTNLFIGPEKPPYNISEYTPGLESFDPRSTTPKQGTLYFNTDKSFNQSTFPTDFSTAGLNGEPFTPLSQLGVSFYNGENSDKNLSWETLYNSDHSPKNNPQWKAGGLSAVNYPNVNRDNLNMKSQQDGRFGVATTRSSVIGAVGKLLGEAGVSGDFQEFLQDTGKEPYIVSSIGKGGRRINSNFLGRGLPIERSITDTLRLTKYLTSPAGIAFIAKQNFLGQNTKSIFLSKDGGLFSSSQRFKETYNPLSTLIQTFGRAGGGPVGLLDKTEPGLSSLFGTDIYPNTNPLGGNVPYDVNKTFTDGSTDGGFNFSDFGNQLINTLKGAAGVPVPIKEKSSGGDRMTLAKIARGDDLLSGGPATLVTEIPELNVNATLPSMEKEENGMPFYFKDLRDNSYIFFRAYIEGLTENISPSYAPHNYVGRSEPVWVYERAEREISMTLKLVAQTKDELSRIYEKMNRLTSLCYPQYSVDEYGNRMQPPITKFRYGEFFGKNKKELMGYVKSISYSVDQSSTYETEVGKRVPRHVLATIGYQVIHREAPRLGTQFYGYVADGEN